MSIPNKAAWLEAKQDPTMSIRSAPYTAPGPSEVTVRTQAVAINPADCIVQQAGILIKKYPAILECDAAGEIVQVGHALGDQFKPGDRVIGAAGPLKDYKYSAFQEHVVLQAPYIARVPKDIPLSDAVVLPLAFNTAACCLFAQETLALDHPPSTGGQGKSLLIWGASSSLGCCGIQLATAAGYEVIAVASRANFELLHSLGADFTFDYNEQNIIEDTVKAITNKEIVGAFDCISNPETLGPLCEILARTSTSRKLIVGTRPGCEAHAKMDVTVTTNFVVDQVAYTASIGTHLWQNFLPAALETGRMKCKPDAEIVGHGLEKVQEAIDLLNEGVSAKKLVVAV